VAPAPAAKGPKFLSGLLGKLAAEKPPTAADLYEKALALERTGRVSEALELFKQAANANIGAAATRLGEIYAAGAPDVPCDPKLSNRWFSVAEALGEKVSRAKGSA
jgi:TPR repeat protein